MSEYSYRDDDRDRRRSTRTRTRDREPEYIEETTYIQRGHAPIRDLVFRGREDSIEDIPRAFPPPRGSKGRRARSVGRRDDYDDYDDDYYDRSSRRGRLNRRESDGYYSDDYDRPPRRERRKSRVGEVLEDLGLGGVAATAGSLYRKARSKSRDRGRHGHDRHDRYDRYDRSRSSSRSRSGSRHRGGGVNWQHAARAALMAGAVEAVRSRKQPGAWTGEKGTRVATAALTAAGIDGLVERGKGDQHSKRHTAEAVIGGLVSNRLVNGSRSRSRGRGRSGSLSDDSMPARSRSRSIVDRFRSRSRGRERSRSQSRDSGGHSGLKKLAAGGALAAAGKTIYDRIRSKSRRRRSPSNSSADSYVPSRSQRYRNRDRDNDRDRDMDGDRGMDGDRDMDDGRDDYQQQGNQGGGAMMRGGGGGGGGSISSESTTDLETQHKRLRGKELITAGLATAATIHAVHGVWNSINASEKRHKLVAEGAMSPEEARKRRSKALLQDAAAVGVAALGVKGAFSEWKEMKEHRDQVHNLEAKRRKRRKMRERAAREFRNNGGMMGGPYGYGYMQPGIGGPQQYQGPSSYSDGNPYGAGNLPPPPMGNSSERY